MYFVNLCNLRMNLIFIFDYLLLFYKILYLCNSIIRLFEIAFIPLKIHGYNLWGLTFYLIQYVKFLSQ